MFDHRSVVRADCFQMVAFSTELPHAIQFFFCLLQTAFRLGKLLLQLVQPFRRNHVLHLCVRILELSFGFLDSFVQVIAFLGDGSLFGKKALDLLLQLLLDLLRLHLEMRNILIHVFRRIAPHQRFFDPAQSPRRTGHFLLEVQLLSFLG